MANIRDLKKDINYVLGEIIEMAMDWEKANPDGDKSKTAAIIDEAITAFDSFSSRIYDKGIDNKRMHYRAIVTDLEAKGNELIAKLNAL
ncbi:MAG: hypothetical protein P8H91_01935 [Flavobacteriaceae bacterium]|jgi:hypothetical protein|nr:hypothetical protein [Flavobacteriaceae bacterium]MDG2290985.1 hypothetical protein [Flavobacteriaceae bacterium]